DIATGKCVASASFTGTAKRLGLIEGGRGFIHTGPSVVILDIEKGTTLHTIDLGTKPATDRGQIGWFACQRVGNRLYVSNDSDRGLSVIDLEKGKLLDQISVPSWRIGSVHVNGDKATVIGLRYGYGVWTSSLG